MKRCLMVGEKQRMTCNKKKHSSKLEALLFADYYRRRYGGDSSQSRAYKCKICDTWHLTKTKAGNRE